MKICYIYTLFIYSFLSSSLVGAQELSRFDSSFGVDSTSDSIDQRSLGLTYFNHQRDPLWPYENERAEALDVFARANLYQGSNAATDYAGSALQLGLGWRQATSHYISLSAGAHTLDRQSDSTQSAIGIYKADGYLLPSSTLALRGSIRRDYVYQELMQPAGTGQFLSATTSSAHLSWYVTDEVRLLSNNSFRTLSDANELQSYDVAGLYRLFGKETWTWIGLGGEARFSRETQAGYWSPRQFLSLGPRFETAVPLPKQWAFTSGVNLNFSSENSGSWGNGYYASFGGSYGRRDAWLVKLEGVLAESIQDQSTWTSRGLRFFLSGGF